MRVDFFTDSTKALNWLSAKTTKFSKIEKKGVVVNNALNKIVQITDSCPMTFSHVDGSSNPADFVTRQTSAKILCKSNFLMVHLGNMYYQCSPCLAIPL